MKGIQTAMNIEHIENNHFRFSEENRPPDGLSDSMEVMEENKEKDMDSTETPMQEDNVMGMNIVSTHVSPT